MKLYVTTYVDDGNSTHGEGPQKCAAWYGTQADQKHDLKRLKAEMFRGILPQQTDVPTNKAGLLEFLNARGVRP